MLLFKSLCYPLSPTCLIPSPSPVYPEMKSKCQGVKSLRFPWQQRYDLVNTAFYFLGKIRWMREKNFLTEILCHFVSRYEVQYEASDYDMIVRSCWTKQGNKRIVWYQIEILGETNIPKEDQWLSRQCFCL